MVCVASLVGVGQGDEKLSERPKSVCVGVCVGGWGGWGR